MKLNSIFSSNMVFPAHKEIFFYGTGTGNVRILFDGQVKSIHADGDWNISFPPHDFGGPFTAVVYLNDEKTVMENIYVGLVFLMSGQSNMQFKLKESPEKHYLSNPSVRLFSTDRIENTDYFHTSDGWIVCDEKTAGEWSAISYYTGNKIAEKNGLAVGMITCYQGASVIESWLPKGTLESNGIRIPDESKHIDHFYDMYKAWNSDGTLYEKALGQVVPFKVSAVVWYQGESDTSSDEALFYKDELKLLIDIWRKRFDDPSLPFVIIQIADTHEEIGWKTLQKAQYDIQFEVNDVKTVISADVCEKDVIHPPTKDKLSQRIAATLCKMLNL